MQTFVWNRHFVTGLETVDDQHRHLVDLLNAFGDLVTDHANIEPATVDTLFHQLADYADHHFKDEEQMMSQVGVDSRHVTSHHAEHKRFLKEVGELYQNIKAGSPASDLLKFLTHWLAYHILRDDQIMAKQIRLIEQGLAPAQAYERAYEDQDSATEPLLVALNGLFDQVSERNRQLKLLNHTLEAKVRQRTQALSEANQHLEEIAHTDLLTGLPNRRSAMRSLQMAIDQARTNGGQLSCVMIDADGFKTVNDRFGHDAGDRVLIELAKHLRNGFRTDDLVARLGGDEFIVVLPDTDLSGAERVAEQVRRSVAELKVPLDGGCWDGSISMGVAAFSHAMRNHDDLIKAADLAVYQSKDKGRNRVSSHPGVASGLFD